MIPSNKPSKDMNRKFTHISVETANIISLWNTRRSDRGGRRHLIHIARFANQYSGSMVGVNGEYNRWESVDIALV